MLSKGHIDNLGLVGLRFGRLGQAGLGGGRQIYRIRKHDLEEFADVVERYGTYKRDLELFPMALRRGPQQVALPPAGLISEPVAETSPATTH
mgnify:CR=1 FL=1